MSFPGAFTRKNMYFTTELISIFLQKLYHHLVCVKEKRFAEDISGELCRR